MMMFADRGMLVEIRGEELVDTVLTAPSASELPSFVLVCPSNCGSCTLTDNTAVSPSRTSSPVSVKSAFLRKFPFCAYTLITRVRALLKPVRCVPPSCVLMLFTKEKTFSS